MVHVLERLPAGGFLLRYNGEDFQVNVFSDRHMGMMQHLPVPTAAASLMTTFAPMAGSVVSVSVAPGDKAMLGPPGCQQSGARPRMSLGALSCLVAVGPPRLSQGTRSG